MNTNTDLRLVPAYDGIDAGTIKFLSLDIFDTLLWRKVPQPRDLFLMLGHQLKKEGWLIDAIAPIGFAELRIKSEHIVRQRKAKEVNEKTAEVTLSEIYYHMQAVFRKITIEEMVQGLNGIISESDIGQLVALEVALEKKLTVFDDQIVNLIRYAKEKNVPVILVSDTYFEESQLQQLLDKPILESITAIFASCERCHGKGHGLFKTIIDELKIHPQIMLHIGDNFASDCQSAIAEGMMALYYPKYDAEFKEVIDAEWMEGELPPDDYLNPDLMVQHRLQLRETKLDMTHGDFGLTSLRSKLLFDSAQANYSEKDSFFWKYGATVLGPVLTGFTHWIYDRCAQMKEHQVLCLMREGRLYANLIKEYAPYYPKHKLEAKELWASRQYVMRACIRYGTPEELYSVLNTHPAEPFTVGSYFATLGLDLNKVPKFAKYANVKLVEEHFREEITHYLCETAALKEKIIEESAIKRQRYVKYLSTVVDLSKTTQLTFVDVGWIGTIQSAIQMMLHLAGYPINIHGLYLGTNYKSQYGMLQGCVREGYLLNGGYPYDATQVIQRGLYVLEQSAIPNVGSLIDIDPQGNIINGTSTLPQKQIEQVQIVQAGIHAFCRRFGQANQNGTVSWTHTSRKTKDMLRRILMRANGLPTKLEADRFGTWHHDLMITQLVSKNTQYVVVGHNKYYEKFIGDMLPQMISKDWTMIWPSAYAAKYDKFTGITANTVRAGNLPVECFLSHDNLPLRVFLDTGKGYPKRASYLCEMHSNANRSFFIYKKMISVKKPIEKIKLCIGNAHLITRLKSLRLTLDKYDSPTAEEFVYYETNAQAETIQIADAVSLDNNVFHSGENPLSIELSFPQSQVYSIELRLCCETFPLKMSTQGRISVD